MAAKQLVILSGKGGAGKTTVAAALAHLASGELSLVLADADVDAANLELVLAPMKQEEHDFTGGKSAVIEPAKCTACGTCAEVCRFEAVVPPHPYPPSSLLLSSQVEYLIGYEGDAFAFTGDVEADLLSITAVHPMREDAVGAFLARAGADWAAIYRLIERGQIVETVYEGRRYYGRRIVR